MIIAGTGHRPDKLGGYGEDVMERLVHVAAVWLADNTKHGDRVITGMALGWDIALARACVELNIPYICAIPFVGQQRMWPKESQAWYIELLSTAYQIEHICDPGYAPWKMQKRNEWMVDRADMVLALYNGTSGGTGNCLKYVQEKNKKIVNLWEKYEKLKA